MHGMICGHTPEVLPSGRPENSTPTRALCIKRRFVTLDVAFPPQPLPEMFDVPEELSVRHVAAAALRAELRMRPIINERVMRYLNEKNQLRLSEHIIAGVARRVFGQAIVPSPNGKYVRVEEFYNSILDLLCNHCEEELFVRTVCDWVINYRDTMLSLGDIPRKEPWWEEMKRQWKDEKSARG